jgi:hypothetical protein
VCRDFNDRWSDHSLRTIHQWQQPDHLEHGDRERDPIEWRFSGPFLLAEQFHFLGFRRPPHILVQRGQRDFPAGGNLQISGIVNREPVAFG